MTRYKGYAGKYLRVDLTSGKIKVEELPDSLCEDYVGGLGFATRILWDEVNERTDPLGPENRIVFSTGPVTGTLFPAAGRYQVNSKSPLTGIWGHANSGGAFGPELKYAGYDMIVISGRSEKPVYLWIDDDYVELRDASHLWGKTTHETTDEIREELGDETYKVACIGPAGENLVRFACIINDYGDAAGRTGMGAVMGSKRLKAIAVRGSKDIHVHDPDAFLEVVDEAYRKVLVDWGYHLSVTLTRYGTPNLVEAINSIGRMPVKNHWTGYWEKADKIGGVRIREEYRSKQGSCFGCLVQCKYMVRVPSGKYAGFFKGPEYEALVSLGSCCLVDDLEAIFEANHLCDLYGMDSISMGMTIAWAMECYENGLITEEDTGGIPLRWGDGDLIVDLVKKTAFREGFGNVLAEGTRRASQIIGKGTEKYAMQVKGLEISAQDGRAHQSSGLTHATAARGADHLTSLSCLEERGYEEVAAARYGEDKVQYLVDPLSTKYKGLLVKDLEDLYAIGNSLIICWYEVGWPPIFYFDDMARLIHTLTGMEQYKDVRTLRLAAERICTLRRMFNVREGLRRKDDTLPERFLKEPMPTGPAKGNVCRLDEMLDEYYEARGCDKKTGIPTDETLRRLGLGELAGRYRE
ncbi:MAG TPA: aldehyde ferredoxin oxidoreductase [Candidatus Korarchaeota archaeon]|nr:aldehyde ferredoxin oxidoreductase [Candidatus Korarchaeota archaeon]